MTLLQLSASLGTLFSCFTASSASEPVPPSAPREVRPTMETQPVDSLDDAADDPAVWIHPTDPAASLILGTDKQSGLCVYDLSGTRVQFLKEGRLNNVDLRDGFRLADGSEVSLAIASRRNDATLMFFAIDPAAASSDRRVRTLPGEVRTGLGDVYGVALYRSRVSGDFFAFISDKSGAMKQYRVRPASNGGVATEVVREFHVGSIAEGMIADDATGRLFVSEEMVAVWSYPAEPPATSEEELEDDDVVPRVAIDLPRPRGNFTPDAEGIALIETGERTGYIVVSSQGDNSFSVYDRLPPHAYVTSFRVGASTGIDETTETDGLEITMRPMGPKFPNGVLVVQDGDNGTEPQNFKVVPMERVLALLANR